MADSATLRTSTARYGIPVAEAMRFLAIRTHCTGHHSIKAISSRSGVPVAEIEAIIGSLQAVDLLYPDGKAPERVGVDFARDKIVRASELWACEMNWTFLGRELIFGDLSERVVIGWLLEAYHEAREFSDVLRSVADRVEGELADVLTRCAADREGSEEQILATLMRLGLSRREVDTSIPLLATRLIGFLIRELSEFQPVTTLVIISLVGARHLTSEECAQLKTQLTERYGVQTDALDPFFALQKRAGELRHQDVLANNVRLFNIDELVCLDSIANKLHDLIHAFILQSHEIKLYHESPSGDYIPRQPVTFFSI